MSKNPGPAPELILHKELYTVTEVATELRVNQTTVRRWIKQGILPAFTLPTGGQRKVHRIRKATILELVGNVPPQMV